MEEEPVKKTEGASPSSERADYLRRFRLWVVVALALVFLTVAYSMVYDSLIGRITPTIAAREGTLEKFVPLKAVVIRDEKLVTASSSGTFNIVAPEGARVAKGEVIARIGGLTEVASSEGSKEDSGLLTALLELERAEAKESEARSFLAAKQAELKLYEAKEDVKGAARVKAQVDSADEALAAAVLERQAASKAYEERLALSKSAPSSARVTTDPGGVRMRSERPAVISYSWDGLEDTLSPSNPELLDLPYSVAAKAAKAARSQGDEVMAGDVAFREISSISTDFLLYAAEVDPEILKAGAVQKVRFTRLSSEKVTVKVKSSKVDKSGFVVAHMSLDRYVSSMTSMRAVDVELLLESYSGLIIPARAITTGEGKSFVHVLRRDRFVLIEVEVLGVVNGEAAVRSDQLKQGDKVKYDG